MILIYCRVSTQDQDTALQEHDLKKWVNAFADGHEVQWFTDKFSGRTMDRPGWKALEAQMTLCPGGKLVVWRLDRLGRTASGLTKLFDELANLRINLISIKEALDLSTPAGRLMANVLASMAQYETEVRGERVRAGLERAKREGKKWGGSRKGERVKYTEDQKQLVLQLSRQRKSQRFIARTLKLNRKTVKSIVDAAKA